MNTEFRNEIRDRVWEKLLDVSIECPSCAGLGDDPQYTCTTCWGEGGDGEIDLTKLIKRFTLFDDE